MTKIEVNAVVAQAVEHLRQARPGRPSSERSIHREAANKLMADLTMSDLRKVSDEMAAMLAEVA